MPKNYSPRGLVVGEDDAWSDHRGGGVALLVDCYPKTTSGFVHREYVADRMGLTIRSVDDVRPRFGWVVSGIVIRQSWSTELLCHDYRAT